MTAPRSIPPQTIEPAFREPAPVHAGSSVFSPRAGLIDAIVELAEEAGRAILEVYRGDFAVDFKDDASPLTEADLAAHRIIVEGLGRIATGIPILSEESLDVPWEVRRQWSVFWLVDPLDGTREFVKRNGKFTVNIALIDAHRPVLGVVHAPVLERTAWAQRGYAARERRGGAHAETRQLRVAPRATPPWRVLGSRSHRDADTSRFLDAQGPIEVTGLGSSLKFVAIAAGEADLYARFGPTSEWDTAAGQCVLEAAGGALVALDGQPLGYNLRDTLINPSFVACAGSPAQWLAAT